MIYYVNINIDSLAGPGTQSSPIGWNQFVTAVQNPLSVSDTFRLIGTRIASSPINLQYAKNIERWDINTLPPWKIDFSAGISIEQIEYINGGVIVSNAIEINSSSPIDLDSCYIYTGLLNTAQDKPIGIKGCTVYMENFSSAVTLTILFKDSIINLVNTPPVGAYFIFRNSAINLNKEDLLNVWSSNFDNGSNHFNWNSSGIDWIHDISIIEPSNLIFENITIPGSGVYTGYEYDLFGNVRQGVGAVSPTIVIPTKKGSMVKMIGDNSTINVVGSVCEGLI